MRRGPSPHKIPREKLGNWAIMKVSQKVDYALRALVELAALCSRQEPIRSAEIADRSRVPEKFLEAILVDLRKAGLIESRRGPDGGHRLARLPAQISLAEVREAVDGPLSLTPARRERPKDPTDAALRSVWGDLEREVRSALARITLEAILRRAEAQREVPDFTI